MNAQELRTEKLGAGYGERAVLRDLSLSFPAGKASAILGPNGCGKSTLLRALGRLARPRAGRVLLGETDIQASPSRELARRMAILPQNPMAPEGISVMELVRRGRAPWRGVFSLWSPEDEAACGEALRAVGLTEMAGRTLDELSGGQRQRAWIALTLAQGASCLLLDEPTTWLDLPHQIEVLSLLSARAHLAQTTVVSVLHDLNLAARFSDHLVLLGPQGLIATGKPHEVMTEERLFQAFGLAVRIIADPETGAPLVIPRKGAHERAR